MCLLAESVLFCLMNSFPQSLSFAPFRTTTSYSFIILPVSTLSKAWGVRLLARHDHLLGLVTTRNANLIDIFVLVIFLVGVVISEQLVTFLSRIGLCLNRMVWFALGPEDCARILVAE